MTDTPTTSERLLPCPKCNSPFVREDYGGCESDCMAIECQDCGHRLVGTDYEDVVNGWNRRPHPVPSQGVNGDLVEAGQASDQIEAARLKLADKFQMSIDIATPESGLLNADDVKRAIAFLRAHPQGEGERKATLLEVSGWHAEQAGFFRDHCKRRSEEGYSGKAASAERKAMIHESCADHFRAEAEATHTPSDAAEREELAGWLDDISGNADFAWQPCAVKAFDRIATLLRNQSPAVGEEELIQMVRECHDSGPNFWERTERLGRLLHMRLTTEQRGNG